MLKVNRLSDLVTMENFELILYDQFELWHLSRTQCSVFRLHFNQVPLKCKYCNLPTGSNVSLSLLVRPSKTLISSLRRILIS